MKSILLRSTIISDGFAILSNGNLTGLVNPINNQDAATKSYVDGFIANLEDTVQFNDNGVFSGSTNFEYNDTLNVLTINGTITDGVSSLLGGILSNLNDPPLNGTNTQVGVPKKYVDQFGNLVNTSTIVLSSDVTYTGAQMAGGLIYRDPVIPGTTPPTTDTSATAANIISNMVGSPVLDNMSTVFFLNNITSSNSVFINLRANTGITFQRDSESPTGIVIPKDYVLRTKILVTDATVSSEDIRIWVESLQYGSLVTNTFEFRGLELSANLGGTGDERYLGTVTATMRESTKTYFPFGNTVPANGNIVLDYPVETKQGSITTSVTNTSNVTVSFQGPASTTVFASTGYTRAGSFRYIIQNGSNQYNVTFVASDGFVMDPNSNMVIGPSKNGIFWVSADSSTSTVTVYTIGIVDREKFKWTTQTTNNNNWNDVIWASSLSLFVAVGSSGVNNRVMTSPDGIVWTTRSSAVDNNWQAITYSPELELLVAVANTGSGDAIMTSPDAINWTSRTSPHTNYTVVEWGASVGLFLALGTNTSTRSTDGITWVTGLPSTADEPFSLEWSESLGLFVQSNITDIWYTATGVAWSGTLSNTPSVGAIAWSPDLAIFSGAYNDRSEGSTTSTDGITWATFANTMSASQWVGMTWAPELKMFIAVSRTNSDDGADISDFNRSMVSFDGQIWTTIRTPTNNNLQAVAWSPTLQRAVAVSNTGTLNRSMIGELT